MKLDKEINIDQRHVLDILNSREKKDSGCKKLKKDENLYIDLDSIRNLWYEHFSHVFSRRSTINRIVHRRYQRK